VKFASTLWLIEDYYRVSSSSSSSVYWTLMSFSFCLSFSFILWPNNLSLFHVLWFDSLNLYSFPMPSIELLFIVLLFYLDVWLSCWSVFFVTRQTNIGYWNSCACHVQIEEVRSRLNLDVTVASDSPPAPAPIESFTDMVFSFVNI